MSRTIRRFLGYLLFVVLAGCGGGAGCAGCGGARPIRGGYPLTPENRIPHSMQVRLTQQGLSTIETIAPSLFSSFLASGIPVPASTQSVSYGLGTCNIDIGPGMLTLTLTTTPPPVVMAFVAPNALSAHIRFIITGDIPLNGCSFSGRLNVDTNRGSHSFVGLVATIPIARDTHAERLDYFRADVQSLVEAAGEGIEDADFQCIGAGAWSSIVCAVVNTFARGTIRSQVSGQLSRATGAVEDALAHKAMPDPPGCPTGTTVSGNYCNYPDGTRVPALLGTDGAGNFGRMVASITPGVRAFDSYVIAAGDHMHDSESVPAQGMTLDVFGAFTSDMHNTCVPQTMTPMIPVIPEWMALRQNLVPGTTGSYDLGVGVAEDFMNRSLWSLWDSGLFCLGITTRTSQQLSAQMFTALPQLASLKQVIFPAANASMALVLRPQRPPTVMVDSGADIATHPLLRLQFQNLAIDFYAWSEERYVRVLTLTLDLTIPVNLMTDAMGLRPVIGMVTTANPVVTNSQLLTTPPAQLAPVLSAVLGSAVGMFAGNVAPISLPTVPLPGGGGSIRIQIPNMGVQGMNESGSRFVSLFTNLQYVPPMPNTAEVDTTATLETLPFDATVYEFGPNFSLDQLPHVRLRVGSPNDFGHPVEYTWRMDDMSWSAWTRDTVLDITSPSFIAQGDHHVEVRARMADQPSTVDSTPVRMDFTFDTVAPEANAHRDGDELVVEANDAVTPAERLEYQISFDGATPSGEWSAAPRANIPEGARQFDVRVRDLNGNQTLIHGAVAARTIRGGPSTDTTSGCGCSTPGARSEGSTGLLAAIGGLLLAASLLRRRRAQPALAVAGSRRAGSKGMPRWIFWGLIPSFLVALGCNCGAPVRINDAGRETGPTALVCDAGIACNGRCVVMSGNCDMACSTWQSPAGMPTFNMATCTWDVSPTACVCQDNAPLRPGMAGSFLDMAVAADNTVWLSAYSAGDPKASKRYGDLIVGRYDRTMNNVQWTHVDGVPRSSPQTSPPGTWRDGISDSGDDVGRWNSIQLDAMGRPRVAYWDTTHDRLKFASYDGTTWHVSDVDTGGHNGRYASLVLLAGDIPAIAYRATMIDPMNAGHVLAKVRYARAMSATPMAPANWTVVDVASAPTACRANDCMVGQACVRSTGVCTATGTGCGACTPTQACVAGACADVYTSTWVEDMPPGIGLFNSLRLDSTGKPQVVFYNRDRGNLMGARVTTGTTWDAPFIIDGETAAGADIADRGAWATLTVAPDDTWHVAYVDGYDEDVYYVTVANGAVVGMPEIVDSGAGVGATPFTDGDHIIGDSLEINRDATGVLRVVYQDSTAGTMRMAQRGATGWTTSIVDMMNHTGYWARIERAQMVGFYRNMQGTAPTFGVRLFPVR